MNDHLKLPPASEVRKIACLMINGIGDTVCVTPAVAALRENYPDAELTMIVRPPINDLIVGIPAIDRIIHYETKKGLVRRLSFFWHVYRERFDLWVDLHVPTYNTTYSNDHNFLRNSILMRAASARFRLGYDVPQLSPHLTHRVPVPTNSELQHVNIITTTLAIVSPPPGKQFQKQISIGENDRKWVEDQLPPSGRTRIALFFGSEQPADLWPMEHALDFIRAVSERLPELELVLIGSSFERELSEQIERLRPNLGDAALHNFIERATLSQTGALLESCDAMVATDSGPMHMGDAVGLPTVTLFSSKNYIGIWQPISRPTELLNRHVPCAPCLSGDCDRNNECMRLISPEDAYGALVSLLNRIERKVRPEFVLVSTAGS